MKRHVFVQVQPWKGEAVGSTVVTVQDITERKLTEETLKEYSERLEEMVEERTAELKTANEQLRLEIADRKQVEEALQESEAKFRTIFQTVTDMITYVDTHGRILDVNDRVEDLLGYKRDEVVGRNFARLGVLGLRDLPNMVRLFRDTIRAGEAVRMVELEIKHKNGSKVFVEVGTRFIRKNSKVGGVVNVFRDITERKRAEREIEERRMYLEGVLGAAPDAIVTLDAHHRIVEWNPGAEKLFGYSREEVIGQNIDDLVTRPDVFEEAVGFTQTVMGRGEVLPTETVRYRKDGSPVDVIVAGSPILVGDELTGVVAVYTDITERKRAEKQLRRYAAELERANEEVKQFAYIVSHDLRSPLVNLKGFTTELRFGLEVIAPAMGTALPYLDEKQRQGVTLALEEDIPEALGFIESSVTHMDRFISALLKLSRLGRRGLHLEPVDMEALVQATLQTLAHQIEQRQVEVTVGPLPEVVADRTSMEQVMANLLDNAVKYLDPDRRGQIEITAERSHDETTFRIRDNGRGIAKEDMDKVFAPFRRVGKQDVPGEGMGLPYVQALVRRHGGRIWCESGLGVGTTLSFTISNSNHIAEGGHRG